MSTNIELVISGISGRFPKSRNLSEFSDNLFNKIYMCSDDDERYEKVSNKIRKNFGNVSDLDKFDASFFSTLSMHAKWMDPQMRVMHEHAYEAILDAGISPESLRGSNTGVFMACSMNDAFNSFVAKIAPYKVGNLLAR